MSDRWQDLVFLTQPQASLKDALRAPRPGWSRVLPHPMGLSLEENATVFGALIGLMLEIRDIADRGDSLIADHGFTPEDAWNLGKQLNPLRGHAFGHAPESAAREALPPTLEALEKLGNYYAKKVALSDQRNEALSAELMTERRRESERDLLRPEKRYATHRRNANAPEIASFEEHRHAKEMDAEIRAAMDFFGFDDVTYKMLQGPSEAEQRLSMGMELLASDSRRNQKVLLGLAELMQGLKVVGKAQSASGPAL